MENRCRATTEGWLQKPVFDSRADQGVLRHAKGFAEQVGSLAETVVTVQGARFREDVFQGADGRRGQGIKDNGHGIRCLGQGRDAGKEGGGGREELLSCVHFQSANLTK